MIPKQPYNIWIPSSIKLVIFLSMFIHRNSHHKTIGERSLPIKPESDWTAGNWTPHYQSSPLAAFDQPNTSCRITGLAYQALLAPRPHIKGLSQRLALRPNRRLKHNFPLPTHIPPNTGFKSGPSHSENATFFSTQHGPMYCDSDTYPFSYNIGKKIRRKQVTCSGIQKTNDTYHRYFFRY